MWRRSVRSLAQSVALAYAAAPRELRAIVALQAISTACLLGQLYVLRSMVGYLLASPDGLGDLVPRLFVLAVATGGNALATGLAGERQRLLVELVRRHAIDRILDVTTAVDLHVMETVEFHDALARARQQSLIRPPQVVSGLAATAQAIITGSALVVALATVTPVLVPVLGATTLMGVALMRRNSRDLHAVDRSLTANDRKAWYLEDVLSSRGGAKETRVFALAPFLGAQRSEFADNRVEAYRRLIRRRSTRVVLVALAVVGATVATAAVLAALVVADRLTVADAAAAAVIAQQLAALGRSGSVGVGQVYENSLFLADVEEFTQLASRHQPAAATVPLPPLRRLRVDNVGFTYPGTTRQVLTDVSCEITAGQIVAFVGENGSGKTTLTKLLCGLYRPSSGTISWDDDDQASVNAAEWQRRFGVVFQDFVRYELSARLNIAVGRHEAEADLTRVRDAAGRADADGFLARLVDGYDTVLSRAYAGGADLSIGEWQRLALARAFFADAPVLILDEPTSALDPRVEQELLARVRHLAGARTVVLVSHRLSSVRFADRVFVLRDGALVEAGTHAELMARNGHYAELFNVQAAAYRSENDAGGR